jgi:hypothetical protein
MHEATRRVVLAGADGVVFVADSSPAQVIANRESWEGMQRLLSELGPMPAIVQYNKRDLPDAVDLASCDRFERPERRIYPASAMTGEGVLATFFGALAASWDHLDASMRLAQNFGLGRDAFLQAVCAHVGGDERDILTA